MTDPVLPAGDFESEEPRLNLLGASGRRGQIIEVAAELFIAKGYEGTTMRDIARQVGVTEGALYRHFSGKDELFREVLRATAATVGSWFDQTMAKSTPDVTAVGAGVREVMELRDRAWSLTGGTSRIALWSEVVKRPEFVEEYREMVIPFLDKMAEYCRGIDAQLGLKRAPGELESRIRAWMVLVAGAPLLEPLGLAPSGQLAADVSDAFVQMMGWRGAGE
jgi:AcrR family transcriptional regulator